MKLEGASILLTGAGSGIGRAIAIALAARGAHLILTGRRETALEETRALLTGSGTTMVVAADITQATDRDFLKNAIEHHYGQLNALINNAGVVEVNLLANTTDEALEGMMRTNLVAPMALARTMTPLLAKAAPEARIVNVGSMFGDIGFPYFVGYSASKFGMRGFSEALRRELAPQGIGVTYCAPRATKTPAATRFNHLAEPFAMKFDPPEKVAGLIVNAMAANARSAYPKGMERFFVLMQRLFPGVVDGSLIGQFKKAKATLGD